jgi:hypothetical protein
MADSPITDLEVLKRVKESYKAINDEISKASKLTAMDFSLLQKLNKQASVLGAFEKELVANKKKSFEYEYKTLEAAKKIGAITEKIYDKEKSKLDVLVKQRVETDKIKSGWEIFDRTTSALKEQGKAWNYIAANVREAYKNAFFDQKSGKMSVGQSGASAVNAANDPSAILNLLGPWGIILKQIIEIIDGVRVMTGELHKAAAASGSFATGFGKARGEAMALTDAQARLTASYGMTADEVSKIYQTMKATGIEALGAVRGFNTEMGDFAESAWMYAKATGEEISAVAERYADLIRNFGVPQKEVIGTYGSILESANKVAQLGITTTTKYMQAVFSLADSFADVGVNIQGVNKILYSTAGALKNLNFPAAMLEKVAQGLMGVTRASEGWQVFMAKMAGVQGGYTSALFSAQQRGAGGMMPGGGEFDITKTFEMMKSALFKPTSGLSGDVKQLMIERMGSQYGMDPRTTQVFQKLATGGLSEGGAFKQFKDLQKAAKEQQMSTKGMFDIIKNILVGIIGKAVVAIWQLLAKSPFMGGGVKGPSSKQLAMMNKLSGKEEPTNMKEGAIGATIKRSGLMMVHANEVAYGGKVYPVAKTEPFRGGAGNGSNINISMNMNIDEKTLSTAFRNAEKDTLRKIKKLKAHMAGGATA